MTNFDTLTRTRACMHGHKQTNTHTNTNKNTHTHTNIYHKNFKQKEPNDEYYGTQKKETNKTWKKISNMWTTADLHVKRNLQRSSQ
jgi:hypothetical protein